MLRQSPPINLKKDGAVEMEWNGGREFRGNTHFRGKKDKKPGHGGGDQRNVATFK